MTDLTPAEQGYILLPETPDEVDAFLKRDDFKDEQAKRLQNFVNTVLAAERKRVKPMTQGSNVEVFHKGQWVLGTVANAHKGGLLEIETFEHGPASAYLKGARVRWPENTN